MIKKMVRVLQMLVYDDSASFVRCLGRIIPEIMQHLQVAL